MSWTGQFASVSGATHTNLMGASNDLRFRPKRVASNELGAPLTCQWQYEGDTYGPYQVRDISPTGLGVNTGPDLLLEQGVTIHGLTIEFRGAVVYRGDAIAVYQVDHPRPRVGLRFTSKVFDLRQLLMSDQLIGQRLDQELKRNAQYRQELPEEYRAAVADMQHLLQQTKLLIEEMERTSARGDWWQQAPDSRELIEQVYQHWGPRYHALMDRVATLDGELDPNKVELARSYATDMLMPLLYDGPLHRRSYEKPRGYAGDYKAMTMCFARQLLGGSWWGKFLHNAALNYPMVKTVPAREANMRRAIHDISRKPGEKRIITLACGPAIEVNRFMRETEGFDDKMTFYLIDQDDEALEYCHASLNRVLAEFHHGRLPVDLQCLHFSIKQLLKPETDAEKAVVGEVLEGIDLVYSAGLLDYLPDRVAEALLHRVYSLLRPGGRLLIGNLRRDPITAWLLESVLAWHLEYRDDTKMKKLAARLQPVPAEVELEYDDTGLCMFLSIRKPE